MKNKTIPGLPLPAPGSAPRPKYPVLLASKYSFVGDSVPPESTQTLSRKERRALRARKDK